MATLAQPRPLSSTEKDLSLWLLTNSSIIGADEKKDFLVQLELALVASSCDCGCASIGFKIQNRKEPKGGLRPLSEAVVGDNQFGIFIYEIEGILSGMEIYGLASMELPSEFPDIQKIEIR